MKKRIIGLDILRDIGVIFIFFYHFFVEYIVTAGGSDGAMYGYNYFFNILARPASLFLFIISGYALMYNHEEELSLGKYYLRRFKGLFIPFYIAYTLMFVICTIINHAIPGQGIPLKRFIFTLCGVDGVTQLIMPNFYIIGEWFMTCIVICYLLFPVLARLLKSFKYITLAVLAVWYVILLLVHNPFSFTQLMNPLFIIVYFYIGMLLYTEFGQKEFSVPVRVICGIISVLVFVYFYVIGYVPACEFMKFSQEKTELIYFFWSMVMFIAIRDVNIKDSSPIYKTIAYISGISWFVILLHHRIMILFYSHLEVATYTHHQIWLLLLACIILTWLAAEAVRIISSRVKKLFK